MRIKFCPKCGKETAEIYENLCKNCFLEKFSLIQNLPNKVIIKRCRYCNTFFSNRKDHENLEEAVENFLIKLFEDEKIKNISYGVVGNKIHTRIRLKIKNLEKIEEKIFDLITKPIICKYCSLKQGKYFVTILQIRGKVNKKILDEIDRYMNVLHKQDKLAFISSIDEVPRGFDVFIGSRAAARSVVNELKRKYKIKTKTSRKFYGTRRGRKVYRDTILIEFGEV